MSGAILALTLLPSWYAKGKIFKKIIAVSTFVYFFSGLDTAGLI